MRAAVRLRVEGLWAGYRRRRGTGARLAGAPVLRDVTLSVEPGAVTALVGANGAGKTTLLRLVLGFLDPARGRIRVAGLEPRQYRRRFGVGYLPETVAPPPAWTGRELLAWGRRLVGDAGPGLQRSSRPASDPWPPGVELDRPMSRLSRGQVRRVALTFALLGGPALVVLDEPFGGLDAQARHGLRSTIGELRATGATVLVASHELAEVARLSDRATVLAKGRIARSLDGREVTTRALEEAILEGA